MIEEGHRLGQDYKWALAESGRAGHRLGTNRSCQLQGMGQHSALLPVGQPKWRECLVTSPASSSSRRGAHVATRTLGTDLPGDLTFHRKFSNWKKKKKKNRCNC